MAVRFAGPGGGRLDGTSGDDVLWGASGKDILYGFGGKDYLYGGSNDDTLYGSTGTDYLRGQGGNDTLYGQGGTDYLRGGAGVDHLWGGTGADVLSGGSEADYFHFLPSDGTTTDTIEDFTPGEDQLVLEGGLTVFQELGGDVNFDGDADTVLILSNQARIVLLGVSEDQVA